ncbi:MAG: YihY/virulence factor BrkB family protein [Terriglobales bacterium]
MQPLLHVSRPRLRRLPRSRLGLTAAYLADTETHTYASAVAAYALLSFFPFIVLLLTLTRNFLHSERLYNSLLQLLRAYLPVAETSALHNQSFILRNLEIIVEHQRAAQWASLVILLVTCTGVFMPLEVALNRIWGAARNRSYLRNGVAAIALAFACGVLGMLSASFTALTETYSARLYRFLSHAAVLHAPSVPLDVFSIAVVRASAVPFTIAIFFLVYWRLPNRRVPTGRVLPAAVLAGVLWEISKYLYILLLPWLNFDELYGPFAISITLLLWAYVSALILLTCAELTAPRAWINPLIAPSSSALVPESTSPTPPVPAAEAPAEGEAVSTAGPQEPRIGRDV